MEPKRLQLDDTVPPEADIPLVQNYSVEPLYGTSWTHEIATNAIVFFKKPLDAFKFGSIAMPRLLHLICIPQVNLLMYNEQMKHYADMAKRPAPALKPSEDMVSHWRVPAITNDWKVLGEMQTGPLDKHKVSNHLVKQRAVIVNFRGGKSQCQNYWGPALPNGAYCHLVLRYSKFVNGQRLRPVFNTSAVQGISQESPPPVSNELAGCFPEWVAVWSYRKTLPTKALLFEGPEKVGKTKWYLGESIYIGRCIENHDYDASTMDPNMSFQDASPPRILRSITEIGGYRPLEISLEIMSR